MRCVICNGETIRKNVEYKESGVPLGNFSAYVCQKCGETYFDEKIAEKIQQKSKQMGLFGLAKKAKVAEIGNSIAIRIPKEIAEFLKLKKGKEVVIFPENKNELHITV
ncbi:AbrB/MazE/SpoVT family DNA-binding domain-containing protein [Candidatus Woesearchaeota archaeon]|nr:AbrB/MazE/SpoVT family DNA-binding domain-containing protein [Candidatus Woesearchaeota archaeon]